MSRTDATHSCHRRDHLDYCDAVAAEVQRFAGVVAGCDPAAPVPSCPGWTIADLVRHVGGLHRWATAMVRDLVPERLSTRTLALAPPEDPADWPGWLRTGGDQLVATLTSADPDAVMWSWGSDKRVRFWGRRMLHETAVHRVDAELACGRHGAVDPADAVDAIDELLDNLPHASYFRPAVDELRGTGQTIGLHATDEGVRWRIRLLADRFEWDHAGDAAHVGVAAPAGELLLLLYARSGGDADAAEVTGDRALLDGWLAKSAL